MAKSKYKNKPQELDGHRFPSKRERNRYLQLKLLERAGNISRLEIHPRYDLVVNGMKVSWYEADFRYFDNDDGLEVVEDVKGVKTPLYRLKKKMMLAIHGIDIKET